MYWVILIIAGVILLYILGWYFGLAQCPKCKSRSCSVLSKEETDSETIYFKKKQYIREYKNDSGSAAFDWQAKYGSANRYTKEPEKLIEKEVLLPGTRTYYNVKYVCKKCGNEFYRKEHVDTKPEIV